MNQSNRKYDLEERTALFGELIIGLCKRIPVSSVVNPLVSQLIRSATSIGANYCEANGASSKKDFRNKITISKKESKETEYWLRMLAKANDTYKEECRTCWKEAHELTLIFSKIVMNTK